jgi:hypothetical protein
MPAFQLQLPQHLKRIAEQRAAAAGYESIDSYIASLIDADCVAPISEEMEAQLIKGLESGPAVDITPEFLTEIKRRARIERGSAA